MREELEAELQRLQDELEDYESMDPYDIVETMNISDWEDAVESLRSRIEDIEAALS